MLTQGNIWILIISIFWILPWKGYATWTAARERDKVWFIVLLLLNTVGILEIIYLFYIAKKDPTNIIKLIKREVKNTR